MQLKFIKTQDAKALEYLFNAPVDTNTNQTVLENPLDFTPTRATSGSNGFDLRACIEQTITIYPDEVVKIPTGIKISLDIFTLPWVKLAGLLIPRSSNKGCILNNVIGLVDSDYQGEIFVKWRNVTPEPITFEAGERFAQLIIVDTYVPEFIEVNDFLKESERGENGFGSSGI